MSKSLQNLISVIDSLLGPNGCPWDKEQTPTSLCDYVIEEAFELVEAIRSGNSQDAREELGDLMFLLLFLARLYADQGEFTLDHALDTNAAKMIRRHPHVFDTTRFKDQEELLVNWERIKRAEKKGETDENGEPAGVFTSLPKGLPPLLRAYRINSKAARIGFTWPDDQAQEEQLASEWAEWKEAEASGDAKAMELEFGDYLFCLVEMGRRRGIKANAALHFANAKFLDRFQGMEALARERGLDLDGMSLEEMDRLWDEVKRQNA